MPIVAIDRLNLDFQPTPELSEEIVELYSARLKQGETVEPLEVFFNGETYWLFDGFHRVAAAKNVGLQEMEANVTQGNFGSS